MTERNPLPLKNWKKAQAVIAHVIEKRPSMTLQELINVLYHVDMDHYEKFEEQLMGLEYIKTKESIEIH